MPLRRIVVGIDFSPASDIAAARAVELAQGHGAELVLVHAGAVDDAPEVPAAVQPAIDARLAQRAAERAGDRERLAALDQQLAAAGVRVSHVVIDDHADDALVETATQVGADLVVTGARELSGARRFFLGSTAEKVVRAAPCSVLCARGGDPDRGFSRVIVGTDFSDAGANALARAVDVAEPGATIELVHSFQQTALLPVASHATQLVDDYRELEAELHRDLEARGAAAIAVHAGARATFRFHLRDDNPRDALRELATEHAADLVVVGNHGKRRLQRWLLGSVAESVISDAPCSVLVAR